MSNFIVDKIIELTTNKGIDSAKEKWFENKLKKKISEFNSDFETEVLDCNSFGLFLDKDDNINKIFDFAYETVRTGYNSNAEFINEISNEAYNYFNLHKEEIKNIKTNNKEIFYKYFEKLIKIINELLFEKLGPKEKSIVKLIDNNIGEKIEQSSLANGIQFNKILSAQEKADNKLEMLIQQLISQNVVNASVNSKDININKNTLSELLKKNNINFTEENEIVVSDDQELEGEMVLKYNDIIKKFSKPSDLITYAYYTQKPFDLDVVSLTIKKGKSILEETVIDKDYTGPTARISFKCYGGMKIATKSYEGPNDSSKFNSGLQIIPPKINEFIVANIENDNYDTILNNVVFKIEERKINDDNIIVILSNKDQHNSYVYIRLILKFADNNLVNTKIQVSARESDSAIHNLQFLKLLMKFKENKTIVARKIDSGEIFFEGNINLENDENSILEEIKFIKTVLYIQDKLSIRIKVSSKGSTEDVKNIFDLKEILDTGKVELEDLTITNTYDDKIDTSKIIFENEHSLRINCNKKYKVFDTEIDLGERIYILPKVKIKSIEDSKITVETVEGSRKLCVFPKYYGDFSVEEICKMEGININNEKGTH